MLLRLFVSVLALAMAMVGSVGRAAGATRTTTGSLVGTFALGLCLGCEVFALLMKAGIIPDDVCEECNNIWAGRPAS